MCRKNIDALMKRFTLKKYGGCAHAITLIYPSTVKDYVIDMCNDFGDYIPLGLDKFSDEKRFVYLHYIEVSEKVRRKGLGSQLISNISNYARKKKLNILLTVNEYNEELHKFYVSNDFERISKTVYYRRCI